MIKSAHHRAAIGGVFSMAFLAPALAAQPGEPSGASEEVVVLGTQLEETLPQELEKLGNKLEVITAEQIEQSGYNDATQALQMLVPGLYAVPKNGPFDYLDNSLLGSRNGDILFLIDGIRISNRLYNGTSPLDTIPAHMIERIEVLQGGQGVFYGTNSVAGVVNIVTKPFSDTTQLGVGAAADTNHGGHGDGYINGTIGTLHGQVYASWDKSSGFQPFRDQDYQPSGTDRNRGYNVRTAGTKFGGELSSGLALTAFYQHTEATLDYAYPYLTAYADNRRIEDLVSAKLDWQISDSFGVFAKAYYHDWVSHYDETDNVLDANTGALTGATEVISDYEFWGYKDRGINVLARLKGSSGFEYLGGLELQRYSGRDEVYTIAPSAESVTALFAQVRNSNGLLPDTDLALGARYSHSGGHGTTVWNLSGKHQFGPDLYMRATGGSSYRLPDAYQLFGAFINEFDFKGNPNLKPERSLNADFGIGGIAAAGAGHFTWEVTGFWRRVSDLIGTADDGYTDVDHDGHDDYDAVYVNTVRRTYVRGAELQVGWKIGDWNARADYTYANARDGDSDTQIERLPRAHGKLLLAWAPETMPLTANASLNWVGDVYQTVNGTRYNYGRYTVLDLGGTYRFGALRRHSVTLSLQNAFDREYASRLGGASTDVGGTDYTYWNLGAPRTWQLRYGYELK